MFYYYTKSLASTIIKICYYAKEQIKKNATNNNFKHKVRTCELLHDF